MTHVPLGPVDQVRVGKGRTFVIDDRQIAVFRLRDGSLRALDAVCPHRGGPLIAGLPRISEPFRPVGTCLMGGCGLAERRSGYRWECWRTR